MYMDSVVYNSGSSPLYNNTNFTDAESYHNFTVYYEATQNYTASYETFWLNVTGVLAPDFDYPQFSNYQDNSGMLTVSGTGEFNVTVTSTNSTVLLEINGVNVTATNETYGGDLYNATYNFVSPGVYSYLWHSWGNGTNANYNQSEVQSYTVNSYTTPPTFDNLRNFTQQANLSFSQSITASDPFGIDSYWLNDTTNFIISQAGLITNVSALDQVNFYWLNISVNDTYNNIASDIFYINISGVTISQCGGTYNLLRSQLSNSRPYGQLCYWKDFR
jgi:hypothetical protein